MKQSHEVSNENIGTVENRLAFTLVQIHCSLNVCCGKEFYAAGYLKWIL